MSKEQTLDISWEAIAKVFIAIFAFYLLYLARDVVIWFFFGLAVSVLLDPAINFMRKLWMPKIIAIILIYFSIFGILGLIIYFTAPIFITELKQLSIYLPDYFERISPVLRQLGVDFADNFGEFTQFLLGRLEQGSKGVFNAVMAFFGGLSSTIFILTIAFFLSLAEKGPERFLSLILPQRYEGQVVAFFEKAQTKVAGWFGARILACLFVGVSSFIVFYIFGIKYAFLLAVIAGVMNFVPYIGPWITAAALIVFVFASSNSLAAIFYIMLAFMAIQAVENNLLTPLLMKKMIDLPPVLVLISLLAGAKIFGFLGMIFAVPAFGIIYEFGKEYLEKRRENFRALD